MALTNMIFARTLTLLLLDMELITDFTFDVEVVQLQMSWDTFLSLQWFLKTVLIYSVDFRLALITVIIRMYLRLLISDLDLHSAEVHIVSVRGIVHSYY